jgi:hypothetical protein
MADLLAYPADHWCPRCERHLRTGGPKQHLEPLCPLCADDDRRVLESALKPWEDA